MLDRNIHRIISLLKRTLETWETPIVTHMAAEGRGAFQILISTILSSRTKDDVTAAASERLFKLASNPENMLRLSEEQIEKAIYPVGFYKTKARNILRACRDLLERYAGRVPESLDDLLTLPGVGRKTANLVIALGFDGEGLCVDTHVHRISNRLGYVQTKTPQETEMELREKLPRRYWTDYNTIMVAHGQNICKPISPFCSRCPVFNYCDRVGVVRKR
jgi:endonuclease-3